MESISFWVDFGMPFEENLQIRGFELKLMMGLGPGCRKGFRCWESIDSLGEVGLRLEMSRDFLSLFMWWVTFLMFSKLLFDFGVRRSLYFDRSSSKSFRFLYLLVV